MSRVGKQPISIADGVQVTLDSGRCIVKGARGELSQTIPAGIEVKIADGEVQVSRPSDSPSDRALHGLTRALIQNMVLGVTEGFRKTLEIVGTGYRAELQGQTLVLRVGFSHQVMLTALEGATFEVETPTVVHVDGNDKQIVGQQAALIRDVRRPEPYQGKGIRYRGEYVRRKAGKRA